MKYMKQKYVLDFEQITDRESLHAYLKETLNLPDYYGMNLDALYDCLTERPETTIELRHIPSLYCLGEYANIILEVFEDASGENPAITLLFTEE